MKLNKTEMKQVELIYKDIMKRLVMSLLGLFMMTLIIIFIYYFNNFEPVGFIENVGFITCALFSIISLVFGLWSICQSFSKYGWNDVKEVKQE